MATSAIRNANNAVIGGFGLLLNKNSSAAFTEIISYSNHLLVANLNPATTEICYK